MMRTTRLRAMTRLRLHHSGTRPVRVLLIGERAQLASADPSLAQRAVDRVWLTTRRGVDLDAVADLAPVLEHVAAETDEWRLWRYDAVVVLLDAALPARRRAQVLRQLIDLLRHDAERGTPVVLVVEGRLDETGRRLLDEAEAVGGAALRTAPTSQVDDRALALRIGAEVDDVVRGAARPTDEDEDEDESARQRALDAAGVLAHPRTDPRLHDLVELARSAFGAESAEINFIDHDRQWKLAVAGAEAGENPRAHSFCSETIRRPQPLVVGDARLHPVLRSSPLVHGPRPIRFYAAHPIESAEGWRIGSFCVYDSQPRDVRGLDLSVLRDLALLAQAELIAQDSVPRGLPEELRRA